MKILHIEDNPDNRRLVRRLLAAEGYDLLEAEDGLEGIDKAVREAPDLILLDIGLPRFDGYEAAAALRAFPALSTTPIVALTAYANPGDRERTLTAGCDGYIAKPIDVDRFPGQVAEFLRGKREQVEPAEQSGHLRELNQRLVQRLFKKIRELEQANHTLSENLRIQSEFLSNMSHEIRTPLNSILGLLQLILGGLCRDPEEERSFLAEARAAGEHLLSLINNVLDLAKAESGSLWIELEPVELGGLFEEIRTLFADQAGAKGLTLTLEPPDPGFRVVRADPDRLNQVLVNLVGNSLKFTERGTITLRTLAGSQEGFVTIEVADTGIGIPPERQARLFQKFVQADGSTTRQCGGGGLGLVLSRHLVEMMGGTITLESRGEGQGTTVALSLPLSREPASAPRDPAGTPVGEVHEPDGTPLILIVEDNPTFREILEDFLQGAGYQTIAAGSADEAMEVAGRLHPGLLITDLSLSRSESATLRTGVDLVAAVTRRPDLRSPGIILLTGDRARAQTLLRDLEVPLSHPILQKPVQLDHLLSTVERVLSRNLEEVRA